MAKKRSVAPRKKAGSKPAHAIEQDIKNAMDSLPNLIVRHLRDEQAAPEAANEETSAITNRVSYRQPKQSLRRQRVFLWTGVTLLTSVIFMMWYWNARTWFLDFPKKIGTETALFGTAEKELRAALQVVAIQDAATVALSEEQAKEKVRHALRESLFATASATTTPSFVSSSEATEEIMTEDTI